MPTEKHKPLKTEVPIEATMETKIIKAIEEVKIIITKTKTTVNTAKSLATL